MAAFYSGCPLDSTLNPAGNGFSEAQTSSRVLDFHLSGTHENDARFNNAWKGAYRAALQEAHRVAKSSVNMLEGKYPQPLIDLPPSQGQFDHLNLGLYSISFVMTKVFCFPNGFLLTVYLLNLTNMLNRFVRRLKAMLTADLSRKLTNLTLESGHGQHWSSMTFSTPFMAKKKPMKAMISKLYPLVLQSSSMSIY